VGSCLTLEGYIKRENQTYEQLKQQQKKRKEKKKTHQSNS
jgi:hypothetical protein